MSCFYKSITHLILFIGLIFVIAFITPAYSQSSNKIESITVCEKDTLFLSVTMLDSALQEVFYQWQIKEDTSNKWIDLIDEKESYFIQYPINPHLQYKCIVAFSDSCFSSPDCQRFTQIYHIQVAKPPKLSFDISPATCGQRNAAIEIHAKGENSPYKTTWKHFGTTNKLTAIPSDIYYFQVADIWGCKSNDSVFVPQNSTLPSISFYVKPASCGKNNGEIHTIIPNNQSYTYTWNTGSTSPTIHHLAVGKYSLQVKNDFGCVKDTIVTVSQFSLPSTFCFEAEDAHCGKANGSISIKSDDKTQHYHYLWNNSDTTAHIQHLQAGFYSVTISDKEGCTEELKNIEVKDISLFKPRLKIHSLTCANINDGKIEAKIMGGDSLFLFSWSNGEITRTIENLAKGSYQLRMQDKQTGCIAIANAEITAPSPITIEAIDIPDSLSFALKIEASGGTPPYIYALNEKEENYQPFSIFDSLQIGNYQIFVKDANNCIQSLEHNISTLPEIDASLPSVFISNIISPDNDGKYDAFTVKSPNLKDAYIEIFNSKGDLIFEDMMSKNTWRGSANAAFCLPGIYYYFVQLDYENGLTRDIKGSVRLIR